jgi:hypothetical protein
MSFLGGNTNNQPAPPTQILGLAQDTTTTNQQSIPVPYLGGIALIGIVWLDWFRNFTTNQTTTSQGGGS